MYQVLLALPALAYLMNKRAARLLLMAVQLLLLVLHMAGFYPLQLQQILVLVASLVLLLDPMSNPQLIALVALIGVTPLPGITPLVALTLLLVVALSMRKSHGRVGLYSIVALSLALVLEYSGYSFAGAPIVLFLAGAFPFHRWLADMYSDFKSAGILVAFIAVAYLNEHLVAYASVAQPLLFLGALTTIVGVFQCMTGKRFAGFLSGIHQIIFGILLVPASVMELGALFYYLLPPAVLSLSVINSVYDRLGEETGGDMLGLGGLSSSLRVEAASVLSTYMVLFSLVSMVAEVLMLKGVGGSVGFTLLGCATLFAAAASLAAFFRGYTLVFEGPSKGSVAKAGLRGLAVALASAGSFLLALVPAWSLLVLSLASGGKPPEFESLNILLLIMLVAASSSAVAMAGAKPVKAKSWMGGYAGVDDLRGSRGEIFTSWREIFKPLYDLRSPDEGVSGAIEGTNPLIILAIVAVLAIIGVVI